MMGLNPFRDGLVEELRRLGFSLVKFEQGDTWYILDRERELIGILFGDQTAQRDGPNAWFADEQSADDQR